MNKNMFLWEQLQRKKTLPIWILLYLLVFIKKTRCFLVGAGLSLPHEDVLVWTDWESLMWKDLETVRITIKDYLYESITVHNHMRHTHYMEVCCNLTMPQGV